jgi:DinB family protein
MDPNERAELIQTYESGAQTLRDSLAGISDAELDARPGPDDWTAREIVHHLADSEMRAAIRLRQLIAEDDPVIEGYDEKIYTRVLHYDRPIATSLDAALAARRASAELLARLTDAEWKRSGTHTESGSYSVEDWLRIYAAHPQDHADQIRRARSSAS